MIARLERCTKLLVVTNIALVLFGCASSPDSGDIVQARVIVVIGEWLYQKVASKDQSERLNNPHSTQAIQDAINAGVSIQDVREGRLVICSCRYGSNSGRLFIVLLPKGLTLPHGDRVDLEIEAGAPSDAGRHGTLSVFRRILPERTQGRTDCFADNR